MAEVAPQTAALSSDAAAQRELVFDRFRRSGYLAARLDPLGFFSTLSPPELDDKSPWSSEARSIYCGTIGADFMHIADPEWRAWRPRFVDVYSLSDYPAAFARRATGFNS